MKIILIGEDLIVQDIVENVMDITYKDLRTLQWSGGSLIGLKGYYLIKEDDFEVTEGDLIAEEVILPDYKELLKEEVNNNVQAACFLGFTSSTTGWSYETEAHDQDNFTRRMVTVINDPSKLTVSWKTADGMVRQHTREQFLAVCDELDAFITSKVNTGWKIKNIDIENAATLAEAKAVDLRAGLGLPPIASPIPKDDVIHP